MSRIQQTEKGRPFSRSGVSIRLTGKPEMGSKLPNGLHNEKVQIRGEQTQEQDKKPNDPNYEEELK